MVIEEQLRKAISDNLIPTDSSININSTDPSQALARCFNNDKYKNNNNYLFYLCYYLVLLILLLLIILLLIIIIIHVRLQVLDDLGATLKSCSDNSNKNKSSKMQKGECF